jgi:cytochrome c peroxidase
MAWVLAQGSRALRAEDVSSTTSLPLGLPPVPTIHDNRLTAEKIALGRKLFLDPRLSRDGQVSCSTCHVPEQGFALNGSPTAIGVGGAALTRNAPSLLNVVYAAQLFRDGRADSLEQQVWGPLLHSNEMANDSPAQLVRRVEALPDYIGLFEPAFGDHAVTPDAIAKALASYERSLLAGNSRFDRWYFGGDATALSTQEQAGFRLFRSSFCSECHTLQDKHALFTDNRYHNIGVGYAPEQPARARDTGRHALTKHRLDWGAFRTPTLRNVALTAPYMHDGSLGTLMDVVDYYNAGGSRDPDADSFVAPLNLTYTQKKALVAFLRSLTSEDIDVVIHRASGR